MNIGIIFAGGVGARMHRSDRIPKQFIEVCGEPIIVRTLRAFEEHSQIDAIVVACVRDWMDVLHDLVRRYGLKKVVRIVEGGETSQLSILKALRAARECSGEAHAVALIHDGVRPLIDARTISGNIEAVHRYGSCITCAAVYETIVRVDANGAMTGLVDRSTARAARAPQSFWLDEILEAQERAVGRGQTDCIDCCTLMREAGKLLHLYEGPRDNIKITTVDDLYALRAILQRREDAKLYKT